MAVHTALKYTRTYLRSVSRLKFRDLGVEGRGRRRTLL